MVTMYINLLIKIKNAERAGKKSLKTPFTKMDYAVAEVLKKYGFLKKIEIKGRSPKRSIDIVINKDRMILGIKFTSRPSLRRYSGYKDLRSIKSGHGISVISTPKGIMSGVQARKEKVGGQLLFEIW